MHNLKVDHYILLSDYMNSDSFHLLATVGEEMQSKIIIKYSYNITPP
jgi:hypothetical protein